MRRLLNAVVPLLVACAAVAAACSDDDNNTNTTNTPDSGPPDSGNNGPEAGPEEDSGQDANPATTGFIKINLTYTGTEQGTLACGVFTMLGTPPLVGVRKPMQTFPTSHTFDSIPPGTYFVACNLDVGNNNVAAPGPEDPLGAPMQVTVTAGNTNELNVTLVDPVNDGGADG